MQAAFCIIRFIFINESMYKGGAMKSYIDIFNLEGKVAVITGGATGLGFSMAQCLAGANATVVLVGRREEELEHACREIGERAHYIRCDITDFEGIPVLVDSIVHRFGGMDRYADAEVFQCRQPRTVGTDYREDPHEKVRTARGYWMGCLIPCLRRIQVCYGDKPGGGRRGHDWVLRET